MSREVAGTSELRMGGYDRFIFSLFYVLHVSVVLQFVSYVQSCHIIRYLMSVPARYMLYICVSCLQSCCFVCSFMLVTDMKYIPFQVFIFIVIHDLHEFQMIYDSACSFTMDIINIIISMINNSLYVIIMLLIYGIKMTWKLPIILTPARRRRPGAHGPHAAARPTTAVGSVCQQAGGGIYAREAKRRDFWKPSVRLWLWPIGRDKVVQICT